MIEVYNRRVTKGSLLVCFVVVVAWSFPPQFLLADSSNSLDLDQIVINGEVSILQPKYWTIEEKEYKKLNGSLSKLVILRDKTEKHSRSTKVVVMEKASVPAFFDVPSTLVKKITNERLIDYYLDQRTKIHVGSSVLKASVDKRGVDTIYRTQWTYLSRSKLRYVVLEDFVLRGDSVYHVYGEYAVIDPTTKDLVGRVVDSVKILSQ